MRASFEILRDANADPLQSGSNNTSTEPAALMVVGSGTPIVANMPPR